jgi:uncharacterized protein with ParB-like and HNH nuclease domain
MQIDAQQKDVGELFAGNNRFEVPVYQRNYAWKNEQVDSFIGDLETALERNDDHFFGSIVVLEGSRNRPSSIIDGQQRMTTFVLLICVIRDLVHGFENKQVMIHGHPRNLNEITTNLLRSEGDFSLRFIANNKIRHIFDSYVQFEPDAAGRRHFTIGGAGMNGDEKRHTTELRRAFLRISKWLNDYLQNDAGNDERLKQRIYSMLMTIRNSSKLLRIAVQDEDDAFILFETLNDRGLRLTPSDLLKSFTLRQIDQGDASLTLEDALEKWDEAVDALGDYPFTKFLRHYLLSAQEEKVQVSKIFALFQKLIRNYGTGGALQNLHELGEAAKHYAVLLGEGNTSDRQLNKTLERINLVSETHRILLLRVFRFRFSLEQIRRLALALEVLSFRWVITGGNAQQIEDFYQDMAMELESDSTDQLDSVIQQILLKTPNDDQVHSAIVQNPARKDSNFQFYVLQKISKGQTDVDLPFERRDLHIEHLAPQRPLNDAGWEDAVAPRFLDMPGERTYDDFLNQWGNLTLLEWEINTAIGNADWQTKVEGRIGSPGLNNSNIAITLDLTGINQWDKLHIAHRTLWVADAIVALTSVQDFENPPRISPYSM